jgi:hypothetical protein
MDIFATFATRKHEPDAPELVVAWDEYCIDSNPEGYAEDVQKSLASWGDDFDQARTIRLSIDDTTLLRAFAPVKVSITKVGIIE